MYLSKDIVKEGNQILRNTSTKVNTPLSSEDLECIKGLYEYMLVSENDTLVEQYGIRPGVGIAAPQVGINKRMFAVNFVDFLDEKQTKYLWTVINPEIIEKSVEMVYLPGGEGCLSVERPTDGLVTPRHYAITVKFQTYDFVTKKIKTIKKTLEGYPAIVFQHEYDHLFGTLYVDTIIDEEEANKKKMFPLWETE